jgi:hypothetical protein
MTNNKEKEEITLTITKEDFHEAWRHITALWKLAVRLIFKK